MSNTVTLNASALAAQTSIATVTVVGQPTRTPDSVSWSSSDNSVAVVSVVNPDHSATVLAIADPSGPSTRTCTISCAAVYSGVPGHASGVATVVTAEDSVSITLEFSPPAP